MPATVLVSKPAKRAIPWSSWTTMSPVRRSANERSAPRRRRPASIPPVRSARRRLRELQGLRPAVPARLDAVEVVGGALALAAVGPGDRRAVAGADELLE